jgi:hypothetical protein
MGRLWKNGIINYNVNIIVDMGMLRSKLNG